MKRILLFTLLVFATISTYAQSQITPKEIYDHIAYLAADDKKGRFPCTPESHEVSNYIRNDFVK
jgi:hypothetical protein